MNIGERFKCLRNSKGLSQREFAQEIGISQGTLSDIEKGKFKPSIETISAVSNYCGVSTDWLIKGDYSSSSRPSFWEQLDEEVDKILLDLLVSTEEKIRNKLNSKITTKELTESMNRRLVSLLNLSITPEENEVLTMYKSISRREKDEILLLMKHKNNLLNIERPSS
ncbi:helix-turn-helix domain-containing protein [Paenibacillus elgii]|uniref:helix-turn-helix domain-containing protein n=1 Tax=Paenibacillus elgii TaxID=189691 RepID=UPI0030DCF842